MLSNASSGWALLSGAWVLTYLLHSTLLLGGVWLLVRMRGVRSEAVRETLWKFALISGVVTASLQVGFAVEPLGGRISLRGVESASETMTARLEIERTETEPPQNDHPQIEHPELANPAIDKNTINHQPKELQKENKQSRRGERYESLAPALKKSGAGNKHPQSKKKHDRDAMLTRRIDDTQKNDDAGTAVTTDEPTRFSDERPASAIPKGIGASLEGRSYLIPMIWAAGIVVVFSVLGLAWIRLKKLLKGRKVIESGPVRDRLDRLCDKAGMKSRVTLSVCRRARIPMAVGVFKPEICLPERALNKLTSAEQNSMLAHELAHLKYHDPFWLMLFRILESLLFFQPLNRLGRHAWQELAEYRCDAFAARLQGNGLPLAQCLTRVAEWVIEPMRGIPVHSMAGNPSCLKVRVKRLLDSAHVERKSLHFSWQILLLVGLLAVVTGAAPGVGMETMKAKVLPEARSLDNDAAGYLENDVTRSVDEEEDIRIYEGEEMREPFSEAAKLLPEASLVPEVASPVLPEATSMFPLQTEIDEELLLQSELEQRNYEVEIAGLGLALRALDNELAALADEVDALRKSLRGRQVPEHVLQLFQAAVIRIEELHQKREQIQNLIPLIIEAPESDN